VGEGMSGLDSVVPGGAQAPGRGRGVGRGWCIGPTGHTTPGRPCPGLSTAKGRPGAHHHATTRSVVGCALCWISTLRACTEWVPDTDHVGGAHVTSRSANVTIEERRLPRTGTADRHDTLWMGVQPGKMELRELLTVLLNKRSRAGEPFVFDGQRALDPYHSERGSCFRWGFAPLSPFKPNKPNTR
jgi:hypothetical protein